MWNPHASFAETRPARQSLALPRFLPTYLSALSSQLSTSQKNAAGISSSGVCLFSQTELPQRSEVRNSNQRMSWRSWAVFRLGLSKP